MKKLIFSAIAVLAVVGSALAFRSDKSVFCENVTKTACDVETFGLSTINQNQGVNGTLRCAATATTTLCPEITIYNAD